jgi:1,5-anhydro-D-fructose reductase (1,5-anhydro-D-mannitol-forming)
MRESGRIGWGLIGASNIALSYMIPAINSQPNSRVVAVMSSDPARAKSFAQTNGIETAYNAVDQLLADPDVDSVYISTTNELH